MGEPTEGLSVLSLHTRSRERGQLLVLFAISIVALLTMAALLFDGAQMLVTRRQLQNAGDAAALAAANVIQSLNPPGCSASAGPPPGAPQAVVVSAAQASVGANLPGFATADISVTCPAGRDNSAVKVTLIRRNAAVFATILGLGQHTVATSSAAVNGLETGLGYSVVLLDPHNASWPQGRRGCPSALFSGAPNVQFNGNAFVNSACPAAMGGPIQMNGNAATVSFAAGSRAYSVGLVVPSGLTFSPPPISGVAPVPDPLWNADYKIPPINQANLPVRSQARLILNNAIVVLTPGRYVGGIELRNKSVAYLRPGIYVLEGSGLDVGAQAKVFSVPSTLSSTSEATWATDCVPASCGVVVFNTSGAAPLGPMTFAAGSVTMLRAYNPDADTGAARDVAYKGILLWQNRTPTPTSTYAQPQVTLSGGGSVDMSGTVYTPSALVEMGGSSGGSGGYEIDLGLQFIAWDIIFRGTASWRFRYIDSDFARPTDYGLIE